MRLLSRVTGGFVVLATLTCASSTPTGPWSSWSTLRLDADAVPMLSGTVEMRLDRTQDTTLLATNTEARLLGMRIADSRTETRIDTKTGRTESYVNISRDHARRFTFGPASCRVERLSAVNGTDAPIDQWEVTSSEEFPYPLDERGSPVPVFDYYGMLLHLRDTKLRRPGDEVVIHVATAHGVEPFRITVSDERLRERTFKDLATDAPRRIQVKELRLRIVPADPEKSDEGFLKMEGETEVWVEAESKTLLNLKGKVRRVPGDVELVLGALG